MLMFLGISSLVQLEVDLEEFFHCCFGQFMGRERMDGRSHLSGTSEATDNLHCNLSEAEKRVADAQITTSIAQSCLGQIDVAYHIEDISATEYKYMSVVLRLESSAFTSNFSFAVFYGRSGRYQEVEQSLRGGKEVVGVLKS